MTTTDTTPLDRLEAAEAGSEALDVAILSLLEGYALERRKGDRRAWLYNRDGHRRSSDYHAVRGDLRVSRSLDAALALAERLGLNWLTIVREALLISEDQPTKRGSDALAMFTCIAILKATLTQEEQT